MSVAVHWNRTVVSDGHESTARHSCSHVTAINIIGLSDPNVSLVFLQMLLLHVVLRLEDYLL